MPRSRIVKKRIPEVDSIYKSRVITRFINRLMLSGKKSLAESIVYNVLSGISEDKKEAVRIFELAIKNVMPKIEVRSRRVGGATYQVPSPLRHDRSEALAIRWVIESCRQKKGRTMKDKLLNEIQAAAKNEGDAIKKKEDTHRMADANRAFAHFKW